MVTVTKPGDSWFVSQVWISGGLRRWEPCSHVHSLVHSEPAVIMGVSTVFH